MPARFPTAERVDVAEIPEWLRTADIGPRDYLVIVTRGHREDLDALRAAIARDTAYVGLIGSKAKIARLYARLGAEEHRRGAAWPASTHRSGSTSAPCRPRKSRSASSPS